MEITSSIVEILFGAAISLFVGLGTAYQRRKNAEAKEEAVIQKDEAKVQYGKFSTAFDSIQKLEQEVGVLRERLANLKECVDKHK
jgi:hypothetical protein